MAIIMDGKRVANQVKSKIKECVDKFKLVPGLTIIQVGDNKASNTYVRNKCKDAAECGIYANVLHFDEATTEQLIDQITMLNNIECVHGIIVQLPLPEHIDVSEVLNRIHPSKDVDCLGIVNQGMLYGSTSALAPCTPAGVMKLLRAYRINIDGAHCVVVGRSNLVGKPVAHLLSAANGTVTLCHSHTKNLEEICRSADILVSAVGKRGIITGDMVKDGVVVVDVGINFNEEGKLCGDVCFEEVSKKASYITPVPGGVGPMTRAMLMRNVLLAAQY